MTAADFKIDIQIRVCDVLPLSRTDPETGETELVHALFWEQTLLVSSELNEQLQAEALGER